jgi:vancomycin permeability regulator SanA
MAESMRERLHMRTAQRRAYQVVVVVTCLVLLPLGWVRLYGDQYLRTVSTVPAEPVGIVFGAGVKGLTPTPFLARRLDLAIQLYDAGKVKVLLVSGDKSGRYYDEPDAMRDYLIRHGIPAARIVPDYQGFDTWDSCERAHEVFGVTAAIVVSQDFHVPRAITACRAAGITAYGVADTGEFSTSASETLHDGVREIPAAFKALQDFLFHPSANTSGQHSDAIQVALRAAGASS